MQELSKLPGRIRFKNKKLYSNKQLSKYLNGYIDNLYGVKYSVVNCNTASILVVYDERKLGTDELRISIESAITSIISNDLQEVSKHSEYNKIIEQKNKSKRNFYIYALVYAALKVKNSIYGKFTISSSVRALLLASFISIIGGYPMLKKIYLTLTQNVPGDSDVLLRLSAIILTLVRESSKGVLLLMMKAANDYIKHAADAQGHRLLNQSATGSEGMAWLNVSPNQEILIPVESLKVNDIVTVHKGELVPADGLVIEGRAVINSLYFSGQPLVTYADEGSKVYEGLSIVSGKLKVRIAKSADINNKTDISKEELNIYNRVKRYQNKVTAVSLTAGAICFVISGSILRSISVMLVLSPSAADTALNAGMKSYIAMLNKHNTYLRRPNLIEKIVRTSHVAFDKTGTLTYGKMKIEAILTFDKNYSAEELIKICAACETDNYHPISITLQQEASGSFDISKVQSTALIPGKGITAVYENKEVLIGKKELIQEYGINTQDGDEKYHHFEEQLFTPIFVSIDKKLTGLIALQDIIRNDSYVLIEMLKKKGINNISLLTGDNSERASAFAKELGISNVFSNLSSEDKEKLILKIKETGVVILVGDGINDSKAMRSSDISISLADSSCDKVKLDSDCIIFEDDIKKLSDLVHLSKQAYDYINLNISISQLYNAVWAYLAFFGKIDTFTAKSINTINSLLMLGLIKRIEYL